MSLLTVTQRHTDRKADPTVTALAGVRLAFAALKRTDPTTKMLPIYTDEVDEKGNLLPPIDDPINFPKDMESAANYLMVENKYSLEAAKKDKEGNDKRQSDSYIHFAVTTKYDMEHLLGLIMGKCSQQNVQIRVKAFPYLGTKTRWYLACTSNSWDSQALEEAIYDAAEKHEGKLQANEKRNLEYMGSPFPPIKVRRSGVRLPGTKGLNMKQQDIDYIEYFSSLRYCNVIEVQDSHWSRLASVLDDMEQKGLFKKLISRNCHLRKIHHENVKKGEKVKFYKEMRGHMNYNHVYTTIEIPGVNMLEKTFRYERQDGVTGSKFGSVRRELLRVKRVDGTAPFLGVHEIKSGPNAGAIELMYHDNPLNAGMVANMDGKLAAWMARYLFEEVKLTRRSVEQFLEAFEDTERFTAWDSSWCSETFTVKTVNSLANETMLCELDGLGCNDIPAELLIEMKTASSKKKFTSDAMERVAASMRFRDGELDGMTDAGSRASPLTVGDHMTTGKDTNRSVTSEQVQTDLTRFRTDYGRLMIELREKSPDDALFSLPLFTDDPMETMSLSSSASTELKNLFKATKTKVTQLRARLAELSQGTPPPSGSAGPAPDNGVGGLAQDG